MGNLPYERVNMAPPFSITGLDLGGPYFVTYKHQRKGVLNRIYVCVCICFVTRAIHLEILSDLTSDAIIATLKRFMSWRGKCSKIFTDNATNFVGANSQLKGIFIRPLTFQIKIWRHISLRKVLNGILFHQGPHIWEVFLGRGHKVSEISPQASTGKIPTHLRGV
ncbi:integrase catalytic domain-containing protein [Trichonephila clavipes]|nr:integrase catalytic domain-containing protein [Trichonephila clavipes]